MATQISTRWLYKPVRITWLDHIGHGAEWANVKDIRHEVAVCYSVGYLLNCSKKTVTIGSTLDDEKTETGDVTVLVRSAITDVEPLTGRAVP